MPSRSAYWLLDLVVAGRPFWFANISVDIQKSNGEIIPYAAGLGALEVTFADGGRPIAIGLQGSASSIAWSELVANGADLEAGNAVLRRWYEGDPIETAEVVAQGSISSPEYGAINEPISFSIDLARYERTATVPAYTSRIDETTWPVTTSPFPLTVDVEQFGAVYPRIYGRPGAASEFVWGTLPLDSPASPAYICEFGVGAHTYNDSKLLIAEHPVAATEVTLINRSSGLRRGQNNSQRFAVEQIQDLRGKLVSVIRRINSIPIYGSTLWVQGGEYYIGWTERGGVIDPETGSEMRSLGRVIIDLLDAAGVPVERGRAQAARGRLDQFLVDAVISEPVRPEDWISSNVATILPLIRRETSSGVWYELLRYDATFVDVTLNLCGDPSDEQTRPGIPVVQTDRFSYTDIAGVTNDITLRYLRSVDGYHRSVRISGEQSGSVFAASQNELPSAVAAASITRYGRRSAEVFATWIADDATAELAAQFHMRWRAFARRRFRVVGGVECFNLRPNDVITYTRAAVGVFQALALVIDCQLGIETIEIELELLERPTQRARG